jgi:hypothetical protein
MSFSKLLEPPWLLTRRGEAASRVRSNTGAVSRTDEDPFDVVAIALALGVLATKKSPSPASRAAPA